MVRPRVYKIRVMASAANRRSASSANMAHVDWPLQQYRGQFLEVASSNSTKGRVIVFTVSRVKVSGKNIG